METARSGFALVGDLGIHNEQQICLYNGQSARKITNGSVANRKEEKCFGENFPETNSTMSGGIELPATNKKPVVAERPLLANECREIDGLSSIQTWR